MPVTVKDIALAAGVSKAAVSKVLHNASTSVRVSHETAKTIRNIADKLGYVPNHNARSLKSSRTNTIGLYFYDLAGIAAGPLYTTHLLEGICRVVFKRHFRVALIAELGDLDAQRSLGDGRLDGAIWCRVVRDEGTQGLMEKSPIPLVAFNSPLVSTNEHLKVVTCDNFGGMEMAVQHLYDLGHRKILFLSERWEAAASDRVDRQEGFRQAMARRDLDLTAEDMQAWDWELEEFREWWASSPPHTAIVCWSERCAGQLLIQCQELGIGIPTQLSVIGFDSTQFCDSTIPPLTAVRQPIIEMASHAANLLLDMIEGAPACPTDAVFPCSLDVRSSTAEPRP